MAKPKNSGEFQMETFESRWKIPNWSTISKDINLLKAQELKFGTSGMSQIQTKWLVGFDSFGQIYGTSAQLYWKLLEVNGSIENLSVKLFDALLNPNGSFASKYQIEETASVGNKFKSSTCFWSLELPDFLKHVSTYIDLDDSVTFLLRLTLLTPKYVTGMKKHTEIFSQSLENRLELLLSDSLNTDVVIITKNNKKIPAHKAILAVCCSYWDALLRSGCLETECNIVKIDDISDKTMKILLHFWYTGKLLPSWQDSDTIVEFVYSAGKYQITEILDMLNETLGETNYNKDANNVVDLLDIVHKLSLKSAEQRLLAQIIKSINNVKKGDELFTLLGIKCSGMSEDDEPSKVEALVMLNAIQKEENAVDTNYSHVRLLGLLNKLSLDALGEKLLAKIVKAVNNVKSAKEFFVLFGFQQERRSSDDFLLVRALPDK